MKLKNSYILLMAMIVLLISIGSVCASENTSTDSDSVLAADQSEIPLEDGEGPQEKINTTVNIPTDMYKYKNGETQTIHVDVKDNESEDIPYNSEEITIVCKNKTVGFTLLDENLTINDKFAVGNHSLLITYLGSDTYASSSKNITLYIYNDKTLEMPSTIVSETGDEVTIPVIVSDGVTNFDVTESDLDIKITYIDDEGNIQTKDIDSYSVDNNNVTFDLDISNFIQVNVTVNYTESSSVKKANIKLNTSVEADEFTKIKDSDDKNITIEVEDGLGEAITVKQNELTVLEGTKTLTFTYNNNIIKITSSLSVGNHTITIKYNGNETYFTSNKTVIIGVYGNSNRRSKSC